MRKTLVCVMSLFFCVFCAFSAFADPLNDDGNCSWAKQAEGAFTGKYNIYFDFYLDEELQDMWQSIELESAIVIPVDGRKEPVRLRKTAEDASIGTLTIIEDYIYEDSPLYGTTSSWDMIYVYIPSSGYILCQTISFTHGDKTYYSEKEIKDKNIRSLFALHEGGWKASILSDENGDEYLKLEASVGNDNWNYLWRQD